MELDQIKEKRDSLEKEIYNLIREFQVDTNVYIKHDGIGFNYFQSSPEGSQKIITGIYIKLEI